MLMMKKRKTQDKSDPTSTTINRDGYTDSPGLQHQPSIKQKITSPGRYGNQQSSAATKVDVIGTVRGKMPAARDGHSATIFDGHMLIFGGDRHRMPFSDTFGLNLKAQLLGKNIN